MREEKRALAAMREEIAARADAVTEAETLIRHLCDQVNTLTARVDAFEAEKQAKAEAEEQAAASAAEYSLPPGFDSEVATSDPDGPPGADDAGDETHGELTIHPSSTPEHRERLEAMDDEGPVPLSYGKLPISYVKGEDGGEGDLPTSLTKKVPPETGTEPELPGPREPTIRSPVGMGW